MIKVKFKKWNCIALFLKYQSNNRTAIQLLDEKTKEVIATASVNLPDVEINDNEIAIKDWSENNGMIEALREAGIIGKTICTTPSGFCNIQICELLKTK